MDGTIKQAGYQRTDGRQNLPKGHSSWNTWLRSQKAKGLSDKDVVEAYVGLRRDEPAYNSQGKGKLDKVGEARLRKHAYDHLLQATSTLDATPEGAARKEAKRVAGLRKQAERLAQQTGQPVAQILQALGVSA